MTSRPRVLSLIPVLLVLAACAATPSPGGASPSVPPPSPEASTGAVPALTPVPGGPAGSGVPGAGLEPTEAESMLLNGMRLELRGACGPVREGLPEGAVAELGCVPATGGAARVAVDLFDAQQPMLDTYTATMTAAGVTPQSNGGICADAPTAEGAWLPGPDDIDATPQRGACWLDHDAAPVYLTTQPPFVLITVTGQPKAAPDTARQYAWAGNEDVPGAPTVWREIPVDAEK